MNTDDLPGLRFEISQDRTKLIIHADEPMRAYLQTLGEEIHSDRCLHEVFESFLCNSELTWILDGETADLTSAPMLGILGQGTRSEAPDLPPHYGLHLCGSDKNGNWYEPILERWGYMAYAVCSLLERLRDEGQVVMVDRN